MSLTELERLEIIARYEIGETTIGIAERFGVSADTVQRTIPADQRRPPQFQRLHLPLDDAQIIAERDAGATWADLGERLGITPSGAYRRYHAACRRRNASGCD